VAINQEYLNHSDLKEDTANLQNIMEAIQEGS